MRAELAARRRQLRLRAGPGIALGLCGVLDARELADQFRRLVRTHFGFQHADVFVWSSEDGCLHRQSSTCASDADASAANRSPLQTVGLFDRVLERKAPLVLPAAGHVLLPMRAGQQVIGLVDLWGSPRRLRRPTDLANLQCLADVVGRALRSCEVHAEALRGRRQAEDADRLKTRLLANVSHELRAPLNVILGYSQAALTAPAADRDQLLPVLRRDLEHIYSSGDHLRHLINDLLDLSRAEVDALDLFLEPVKPRALLEEVFQVNSAHRPCSSVTWRLDVAPDLPVVLADPVRLRQVLDNLLNNARASTLEGEIVLGARLEAGQLHIWVRDTGEGIPADQLERVFDPFVSARRADARRKGIGLGLTITRRLVALHGGTLVVDSQLGAGSVFHVRLPVSAPDVASTAGGVSLIAKPAERHALLGAIAAIHPTPGVGLVLVVDDDPQARALYRRLVLEALPGCRVQTAADGAEALHVIETQPDPPGLVILDLALPTLDGFALLERLRAERATRHVPVLVVSGRLLSEVDMRRLDHARVLYQPKDLLSSNEALEQVQAVVAGQPLLPQATSLVVKRAIGYLHEHYARPLGRHELARAAGVSENYLSQIFHRELGLSPRDYLSRVRVHHAKRLLCSTDQSVAVIASRVGFADPAYFSRVFHRLVGASPQVYRQRT